MPLLALDLETDGVWWDLPPEVVDRLAPGGKLREAVAGVRNLVLALLPSSAACEPSDVGATIVFPSVAAELLGADAPPATAPKLYIYDMYGGVGICHKVFANLERLWQQCLAVLSSCGCASGCASCSQAGRFGREAGDGKMQSRLVLESLTGAWMQAGPAAELGGSGPAYASAPPDDGD